MISKKTQLIIIVVATVLAYSNIFTNDFVWDDQFFIQDWEKVRDWKYLPDMLGGALPPRFSGAFRPLLGVFYLVFYQLFGQNPWGWHAQALVVHIANTVLVYFIASHVILRAKPEGSHKMLRFAQHDNGMVPFATALLFGLHPIHTEAVTYIAASINTIGVMFFFASFYLYLRGTRGIRRIRDRVLSLLFALLAFFTYEFTLTLPLLILLHQVIARNVVTKQSHGIATPSTPLGLAMTKVSIPYFTLAASYVLLRLFLIHTVGRGEYLLGSFPLTMLTMTKAFLRYLEVLILPLNQTVFHTLPGGILTNVYIDLKKEAIRDQSILEPYVLLSIIVITVITIIMVIARKRVPLVTFSIGWFFITLLPASNIVPVQEIMAERYLYIPSFGYVLLVAILIQSSKFKVQSYNSKLKIFNFQLPASPKLQRGEQLLTFNFALLTLAVMYGYLTFERNTVWHSNFTLWFDTTKKSPLSEIAHYNLGNAYVRKGDFDGALASYKRAIVNKPASMGSWINMGHIYSDKKNFVRALDAYQHALAIDPNSPSNHNNVGVALMELGKDQEALEHSLVALLIDNTYQRARDNVNALIRRNPNLDIQETLKRIRLGI